MPKSATSPAASGPAGSHFEGQVGASYLLALLTGSEPRGLPGTTIETVQFQRAPEGRPLDDVVVSARDSAGNAADLEIQVKRTISFTPSDDVFGGVVVQIAEAVRRPDFWNTRYELGIATARTSRKINGAYQDVLTWARQLGDAATFLARIDRPGSANDDMRTFVRTFRAHLGAAGAPKDDETVWKMLRRLQILVFDFTAQGSASEDLAKERAVRALHADDAGRAGALWSALIDIALRAAASGGERTRADLIEELTQQGFRLVGERRYAGVRAALAEASRHALDEIDDQVGGVKLTRHELVAAIHARLDLGRYVEIRGDAGVGKSGLLKHFAEQIAMQSPVIVLSPGRTTPRGWTAMRGELGFDGTAHDLLTDLAGDGAAILFVDNLDFFDSEERRTVIDLLREASRVPGYAVIATARRDFGVDEPSWLPAEALSRLGQAEPLVVGEATDAEVEEVREAAPELAFLLADTHPARNVARNLFRLDRLAASGADQSMTRSEIDMAERWWRTADGFVDDRHRERARVLRALAEQALDRAEPLHASAQHASAVDALVASESLRDLGSDRVTFRHDVLREWAVANLLHSEPERMHRLPLDRPAPSEFVRVVELVARMAIERSGDSTNWQEVLERLSQSDVHGSWRRAALLALVRSEISAELLTRAESYLFANQAVALRELIRLVMAMDVEPAARLYSSLGLDPAVIPANVDIPSAPSWSRLVVWLLQLADGLPNAAIPDVVDLYTAWSRGMLGLDPLTPPIQKRLYLWLTEIERTRDDSTFRDFREPFGGEIDYERMRSLETELRNGFVLFANRTPALAAEYLRSLSRRRRGDHAAHSVLKFRGTLAQAAPEELAELTATALIREPEPTDSYDDGGREQPFEYVDHEFLPASPSQGPFFDLLTHAPRHGLSLTRRLVDHAISYYAGSRKPETDAFMLVLPGGDCSFPWKRSYIWSRDANGNYCVTSALMALEAWAHRRIEAGESFDGVLGDVIGGSTSPAAYLLIAVDLILSHWPNSRETAIPFLACPELLCIDRERQVHDNFEYPDLLGLKALQKEPVGVVSAEDLKKRVSRRVSLEYPLGQVAVSGPAETRDRIVALLRQAEERLGPPDATSTLADPRLMVLHALNLLDPANWQEISGTSREGSQGTAYQYVPPETEEVHLAALRVESQERTADTNMQLALSNAIEKPSASSEAFAEAAVDWAQSPETQASDDDDEAGMRGQALVSAAMVAMRDGSPELRLAHAAWARGVFASALQAEADPVHRFRSGLRFNPIAISFVGMVYASRDDQASEVTRPILEVATRGDPAAAHGFGATAQVLKSIDERLPRAVLRCAFVSCIRRRLKWDADDDERREDREEQARGRRMAVDGEMEWLYGSGPEPAWPSFPEKRPQVRRGLRIPAGTVEEREPEPRSSDVYADHQSAALWLSNAKQVGDVATNDWLLDVMKVYGPWTMAANGAGLEPSKDVRNRPMEWNGAYFDLQAQSLPGLPLSEVELLVLEPLASLPDESFFGAIGDFLRSVDAIYFNELGFAETVAVVIRTRLAERMIASSGWRWMVSRRSTSIERHIGPAIATLFFNQHGLVDPTKCYLLPKGIDRLPPFFGVLEKLVQSGPSLFVALVTVNLLEVSPRPVQLPLMVAANKVWIDNYPDDSGFWLDYDIGRRVCLWIENVYGQDSTLLSGDGRLRTEVDRILAALVRLGVSDARRLEELVANA